MKGHCSRALWAVLAPRRRSDATPDVLAELRGIVDVYRRLSEVRTAIDHAGVLVNGSMGQQRANPLLRVESQLRAEFRTSLRAWMLQTDWS